MQAILELPDALPQPWHARRQDVPRGDVTRHELALDGDESSVVSVYTPPDHTSDGAPYPVTGVGFAIPLSEPDVRVSPHPALYAQLTGCG